MGFTRHIINLANWVADLQRSKPRKIMLRCCFHACEDARCVYTKHVCNVQPLHFALMVDCIRT
jgi:hypothetical protein